MSSETVIFRLAALTLTLNSILLLCCLASWLFTRLRQTRPVYIVALSLVSSPPALMPERPRYADPLPAAWRLPVQPGGPDDVIIHIGPKDASATARVGIEQRVSPLESLS